jgi:hypothetical protein
MRFLRILPSLLLAGFVLVVTPARAYQVVTIAGGFGHILDMEVDPRGNVFVNSILDQNYGAIAEILAAGNYTTAKTVVPGSADAMTIDASDNFFVEEFGIISEVLAADGYTTGYQLGGNATLRVNPVAMALDGSGHLFAVSIAFPCILEMVIPGPTAPLAPLTPLPACDLTNFRGTTSIAIDASGNLFVADLNDVLEITAASGYSSVVTVGSGFSLPGGLAVDGSGNVLVADSGNQAVKEILAAGGYTTVKTLATGLAVEGIGVSPQGNVFVSSQDTVFEIIGADALPAIPAFGPWALLLCALLLGGAGFALAGRRSALGWRM